MPISENEAAEIRAMWQQVFAQPRQAPPQATAIEKMQAITAATGARVLRRIGAKMDDDLTGVRVVNELTRQLLIDLFQGNDVCAIQVKQVVDPKSVTRLVDRAFEEFTQWCIGFENRETDMFYALGSLPWERAMRSDEVMLEYFEKRDAYVEGVRALAGYDLFARMRAEFASVWSAGCVVGDFFGHLMRPGLVRVMKAGGGPPAPVHGHVHTDDEPPTDDIRGASASVILYLEVPPKGGELYVWPVHLARETGLRSAVVGKYFCQHVMGSFDKDMQERWERVLPQPKRISPEAGDMVILHPGRPHAVAPFHAGRRAILQHFIKFVEGRLSAFA